MGFNCGIVGLPNVGKSTLFNALTQTAAAQAANYPFCTIEPNVGRVAVQDERLNTIAKLAHSERVIPAQMECVDIAGLVKGASKGEGLGNAFLGHIREIHAILHVLRCFDDENITHVEGDTDPTRDALIIETELMLADLDSLEKRIPNLEKKAKMKDEDALVTLGLCKKILPYLQEGISVRAAAQKIEMDEAETIKFPQLSLLTSKPMVYVCNVSEADIAHGNDYTKKVEQFAAERGERVVVVSAAIESEIATLDPADQKDYLDSLGLKEPGLVRVVREGYSLLGLMTYFTAGPKEARAWSVVRDAKAPQAAGKIHSDFEIGFICAEVIGYDDYIAHDGEAGAKTAGKWRQEGRDYTVKDGDVIHFRFNR